MEPMAAVDDPAGTAAALVPFVPRLTLEWLRDHPERRWLEVDGTLAFVDISGFTAMSERLSALGKAGAEEVTDVMNATFAALLDVAYAEGGGLLKFGGDALLLLYDGEDHARRAARAAFEMRRTLRTIGRPRTSAGAVQLRMHVGMHSGRLHFFLVGEAHRELLVTGPGATRTVEMEAASEAGEILVSPETAARVEQAAIGDEKGPGRLLQAAPDVRGTLAPLPDVSEIPLQKAVPTMLRRQLLEAGPPEGEHRSAAIGFVRYSGVDEVIATEGPEAAADGLEALVRVLQEAAEEHRVTFLESDVDRDGGRIVLVAGAPETSGDDEERLLRTLRAAIDAGMPFPVHVGANRGRVFTGQVGAEYRRTYTVLGDTAALAARLMARAGEDEILVAAEAFKRGGRRFAAEELEPFQVKGKSEPVLAYRLGELTPESPAQVAEEVASDSRPPFVDRERERAVLGAAVAPVRMGFGTLVELVGEPGIGKSRLAEELETNCGDMRKVTTRCDQYESKTAYYPFRPLLRSLLDVELNGGGGHNRTVLAERLGTIDTELVPWTPLLAAPLDVEVESTPEVDDLDPAFWRARLHGVVGKLLGGLLESPTLFMFEDVHWMDDASSELLRFLGSQLPTKPWLACTTRRPVEGGFAAADGTPPLPALTLRLEPLPEADAKTLVKAAAGDRALSDDEVAALLERGAGNPLFLQELAGPDDGTERAEELPETVEALLATRIDRLSPGDRALLRWASVLGVSFSSSLIAEVLEEQEEAVAAASEAWERVGEFVERDPDVPGAFRFRHALIRDAAYEGLPYRRRREIHERVAEVIERRHGDRPDEAAELLALHFQRAERWPEAWRYSVDAGRRAASKYANVEASQFFEQALGLVQQVPDLPPANVARVWEELGDVRMLRGAYEDADSAFESARRLLGGDPLEQARLMRKEAVARVRHGRYEPALARLSEALQALEGVDGAAAHRARLLAWHAAVLQHQRLPGEAVEWCERAIAEAKGTDAEDAEAHAYALLDWAYVTLGRREEAVYSDRAAEIYERLGELVRLAWVLNNQGTLAYIDGDWESAVRLWQRAIETFRRTGDETDAATAALNVAEVRIDQGRADEVEAMLRAALDARRAAGNLLNVADVAGLLARQSARLGRFEESHALLEEARALYAAEDDEVELLTTDTRLVECLLLEGSTEEALALAGETLARAEGIRGVAVVVAELHRLQGTALAQSGELAAAETALEESLRLARQEGENFGARNPEYEAAVTLSVLARVQALLGKPTEDLEWERDAIFARLGVANVPEPPFPA